MPSRRQILRNTLWGANGWKAAVGLGFVLLGAWHFTTPDRMISSARRTAVQHQSELLREAQAMLDTAAATPENSLSYGFPGDPPMPATFAKLCASHQVHASPRHPGAVKVAVTGGHTHYGLYIIPDSTTITQAMLREDPSLKVVNEHILQYE